MPLDLVSPDDIPHMDLSGGETNILGLRKRVQELSASIPRGLYDKYSRDIVGLTLQLTGALDPETTARLTEQIDELEATVAEDIAVAMQSGSPEMQSGSPEMQGGSPEMAFAKILDTARRLDAAGLHHQADVMDKLVP